MKTLAIYNNDYLRMSAAGAVSVLLAAFIVGGMFPMGFLLLLIIPFLFSIRPGVELDFSNMKYRKVTAVMGMKSGEWKSYSNEHQLVLLSKSGSKNLVDPRLIREVGIDGYYHELYIMDSTHTKRLYLYSSKNKQKIDNYISQITGNSDLKLMTYNPVSARR